MLTLANALANPTAKTFLGERFSAQRNEVKRALPSEPMNGAASVIPPPNRTAKNGGITTPAEAKVIDAFIDGLLIRNIVSPNNISREEVTAFVLKVTS